MQEKLKLLLQNPELTIEDEKISSEYVTNVLQHNLYIPHNYIYSCFALSMDGKLCTEDNQSGYIIAQSNKQATLSERETDYWFLNLTRSLADAVIIGSGVLNNEPHNDYIASINIPELQKLRSELKKPTYPLHVIITRDMDKLNWMHESLLQNNQYPVLIITQDGSAPVHFNQIFLNQPPNNIKNYLLMDDLNISVISNYLQSNNIYKILIESPYYHHKFIQAKLLQEAWLNYSGIYVGGTQATLGGQSNSLATTNLAYYNVIALYSLGYNFIYGRYNVSYETK